MAHPRKRDLTEGQTPMAQNKRAGGAKVHKYQIIRDCIRKILNNWTEDEIKEYIGDKYGFDSDRVKSTYYSAARCALDTRMEKFQEEVAEKNMLHMQSIVDEALETHQLKTAITAIDTLNRMVGLYSTKMEIKTDEPIEISLG